MSSIVPFDVRLDTTAVRRAYARWAPYYDASFGLFADSGRRQAVELVNRRPGKVLEVGVGTGISLPHYHPASDVTAIDLCPEMLAIARARVARRGLGQVAAVEEMDAARLAYDDASFDTVVAMYVMTVVPEVDRVMGELERVCRPGGEIVIVNHFGFRSGLRADIERYLEPLAARLGWHTDFDVERLMGRQRLALIEQRSLKPFGLFTLLRFARRAAPARSSFEPALAARREGEQVAVSGGVATV